ncbi:MAG TPA: type II toxin-antitoxin system HicB family antitoxin [Candidatus Paceibacterota bacterium]|nr:type II toxin-antitoxin system HicB family antitoxin [Candidatus Paceibacterota bacterium]HMO82602.1 type II toxin-antitoxin system HicB family antitoxin [Candidatus Paceibacterota bacterium]
MSNNPYTFQVIYTSEPEGGYTVTVPTLPECITYGATFEEASKNVQEALQLCVAERRASGEMMAFSSNQQTIISSISVTA